LRVAVYIFFYGHDGSYIGQGVHVSNDYINDSQTGSPTTGIDAVPRIWMIREAPAGAVKAAAHVRKHGTNAGGVNSYAFLQRLFFGPAGPSQVTPSDWQPGGAIILADGMVKAEHVAANAITADKLTVAALDGSGNIAAGAVGGTQIAADSVGATQIVGGSITTDHIAASTITAKNLKLGDTSNIILNPSFNQGADGFDGWTGATENATLRAATDATVPAGAPADWVVEVDGADFTGPAAFEFSNWTQVSPGETYFVSIWAASSADVVNALVFGLRMANVALTVNRWVWGIVTPTGETPWARYAGYVTIDPDYHVIRPIVSARFGDHGRPPAGKWWFAAPVVRRAADSELVVDGAITAAKLTIPALDNDGDLEPGTVGGTQIVGGAITTDKIAVGAVTANEIAAGAVVAEKLAITTTANWLAGSDGSVGYAALEQQLRTDGGTEFRLRDDGLWNAGGEQAFELFNPNPGDRSDRYSELRPINPATGTTFFGVEGGKTYQASVYTSAIRCNAVLYLLFYDSAGGGLGYGTEIATEVTNAGVSGSPGVNGFAGMTRLYRIAQAPANATSCMVILRKHGTYAGNSNSYAFFQRAMLGPAGPSQTEPSDWVPGGSVVLADGMVKAQHVAANAITADKLTVAALDGSGNVAADAVGATQIVGGSITTEHVAANAITADKLTIAALDGAGDIAANAVGGTQIVGGSITTDHVAANTITGDNIAANTLTSDVIAANAITAKHLVVADTTNVIQNAGFDQGDGMDGWSGNLTHIFSRHRDDPGVPPGAPSEHVAEFTATASGAVGISAGEFMPVSEGEVYYFSCWVASSADASDAFTIGAHGIFIETGGNWWSWAAVEHPVVTTWKRIWGYRTIPAGVTRMRAMLTVRYGDSGSRGGKWWATKPIMRRAADSELIVDGAISAAKLTIPALDNNGDLEPGSVGGTQIVGGSITTDKIAVGGVTADNIFAGAVTAEKLAVTTTANWLAGSDGSVGYAAFTTNIGTDGSTQFRIRNDDLWNAGGEPSFELINTAPGDRSTLYSELWPKNPASGSIYFGVEGGKCYQASVYTSAHRCDVRIYLLFYDSAGVYLGYGTAIAGESTNAGTQGNPGADGFAGLTRIWQIRQAPANAATCRVILRKHGTDAGGANSYAFFQRPLLGPAGPSQTEPSDWVPGGSIILADGMVKAQHIESNAITADKIAAGEITSEHIGVGEVTAENIDAGAITAEKLSVAIKTTNLIRNPNGIDGSRDGWGLVEGDDSEFLSQVTSYEVGGGWTLRLGNGSTVNSAYGSNPMPVVGGETLKVKFRAWANGGGSATGFYARLAYTTDWNHDPTQPLKNGTRTGFHDFIANGPISGSPDQYDFQWVVPSGVKWVSLCFYRWHALATGGQTLFFTDCEVGPASRSVDIEDGAITANKITANAIGTQHLASRSITSAKLVLTDSSNIVPDAAMIEGSWIKSHEDAWVHYAKTYYDMRSRGRYECSPGYSGGWQTLRSELIPIQSGVHYTLTAKVYYHNSNSHYYIFARTEQFDTDEAYISGTSKNAISVNAARSAGYEEGSVQFETVADARYLCVALFVHGADTTGNVSFGGIAVRKTAEGELIVDGAISATKLDIGSAIDGSGNIAAGAVGRTQIQGGAVGRTQIEDGEIITDKLAAKAVTSAKITSRAITAGKLGISPELRNLIPNATFTDTDTPITDLWEVGTGGGSIRYESNSAAITGGSYLLFDNLGDSSRSMHIQSKGLIPVEPNRYYTLSCICQQVANISGGINGFYLRCKFYDGNGSLITHADTVSNVASGSMTTHTRKMLMHSNARYVAIQIFHHTSKHRYTRLDSVFFGPAVDADLIVEGSIVADLIGANEIGAEKLSIGNVVDASGNLAAGAVNSTVQIANGVIQANHLDVNSVRADIISGEVIYAEHIRGGAVSELKLGVGAAGKVYRSFNLGDRQLSDNGWQDIAAFTVSRDSNSVIQIHAYCRVFRFTGSGNARINLRIIEGFGGSLSESAGSRRAFDEDWLNANGDCPPITIIDSNVGTNSFRFQVYISPNQNHFKVDNVQMIGTILNRSYYSESQHNF